VQLVGIQIYNLDIARIKKQYKEMKYILYVLLEFTLALDKSIQPYDTKTLETEQHLCWSPKADIISNAGL